jgi:hypothetical protein
VLIQGGGLSSQQVRSALRALLLAIWHILKALGCTSPHLVTTVPSLHELIAMVCEPSSVGGSEAAAESADTRTPAVQARSCGARRNHREKTANAVTLWHYRHLARSSARGFLRLQQRLVGEAAPTHQTRASMDIQSA